MTITKIGHCCLVIELGEGVVLTDPGVFTADSPLPDRVDVVVISHEHHDHMHVPTVLALRERFPDLAIIANRAVAQLLADAGVLSVTILEGVASATVAGIYFEAFDASHAEIFEEVGQVQNTGYFISKRLFYPGDAYAEPSKPIEVLALPVGGPWCRITDAIHYALRVAPQTAFPVHDAIERGDRLATHHGLTARILGERGIAFRPLCAGESVTV
jgi:L-ascorbate metabolism protein UlaG (beta-lactamase superfamily)